ncbi:MAG: hypothetical protein ACI4PW_03190 [Alphaproteobacteria bacterium]
MVRAMAFLAVWAAFFPAAAQNYVPAGTGAVYQGQTSSLPTASAQALPAYGVPPGYAPGYVPAGSPPAYAAPQGAPSAPPPGYVPGYVPAGSPPAYAAPQGVPSAPPPGYVPGYVPAGQAPAYAVPQGVPSAPPPGYVPGYVPAGQAPAYAVPQTVSAPLPPARRYRPGMGGVQGVGTGNVRLPVQVMTDRPVYAPAPSYGVPAARSSGQGSAPAAQDPAGEKSESLEQTGIKMFKPEDEGKVMKAPIKNPEFDKLSASEKEDILQRVIVDRKKQDDRKRFKLDNIRDR